MVMTIQTFGGYARWNPHIHAIVADGPFTPGGVFYVMPKVFLKPLAEMFRAAVFQLLRDRGLMDDRFIAKLMGWLTSPGSVFITGCGLPRTTQLAGKPFIMQPFFDGEDDL